MTDEKVYRFCHVGTSSVCWLCEKASTFKTDTKQLLSFAFSSQIKSKTFSKKSFAKRVGHSGLFIGWIDRQKRLALILSYAGENRKVPARYKVYDISSVYHIVRAYEGDKL